MTAFPPAIEQLVNAAYPVPRQLLAEQLAHVTRPLFFAFNAFELGFLLWFFASGLSARLRDVLERRIHNPLVCAATFIAVAFIGLSLIMSPLSFYASFVLPHEFGLSAETVSRWIRDWAVGVGVSAVIVAFTGALFLRALARFRTWPAIAAAGGAVLIIFGSAIFPLFIAPLFNKFTPLPPSPLTRSILHLAADQGINASVVYEYDMSAQTREANAYVAGLGRTERIAVGDTLISGMKPDEVLFVMAHEMGHYKLGHLWLGAFETWCGLLVAIALLATLGAKLLAHYPRRSRGLSDPAAMPFIAALLIIFDLITMPVSNALSRNIEHAADVFAINHTRLGAAGVRAQARLASMDLSPLHPSPIVVWYFYTHPPTDQRIMDAARGAGLAR